MTPQIKQIRDYYDGFLSHLKQDHTRENRRHTRVKQQLAAMVQPGRTALDLGCGTGITSHYMASILGAHVLAVDLSPELINFARKNSAHENINYYTGDITTTEIKNSNRQTCYDIHKYDYITLIDCFEHIQRDRIPALMDRIKERSHEKTVVYLTVPDGRFTQYIKEYKPELLQIVDEIWFTQEVLNEFKKVGFEDVLVDHYGVCRPYEYTGFAFITKESFESCYRTL